MSSRLWDVRSALVTMFTTAVAPVVVLNGPHPRTTPPKTFLLVGSDGGETGVGDSDDDGAIAEQQMSDMGNGWRDERGDVMCAAWAWSGDSNMAGLRLTVADLVTVAELAVRADRTLGGLLAPPGLAEFSRLRVRESHTTKGAVIRAAFTVSYGALLTS